MVGGWGVEFARAAPPDHGSQVGASPARDFVRGADDLFPRTASTDCPAQTGEHLRVLPAHVRSFLDFVPWLWALCAYLLGV
eukprot:4592036-Prymnesium_polylepis.1